MAYSASDATAVYPERRLAFTDGHATVDPFPIGSREDAAGTEFKVVAMALTRELSDRYETTAATTDQFPVEDGIPPGDILDEFSVVRGQGYTPCY